VQWHRKTFYGFLCQNPQPRMAEVGIFPVIGSETQRFTPSISIGDLTVNDESIELLETLDPFLVRHGLADSAFGIAVANNSHLVRRLRQGVPLRRSSVLRIRKYMQRRDLDL